MSTEPPKQAETGKLASGRDLVKLLQTDGCAVVRLVEPDQCLAPAQYQALFEEDGLPDASVHGIFDFLDVATVHGVQPAAKSSNRRRSISLRTLAKGGNYRTFTDVLALHDAALRKVNALLDVREGRRRSAIHKWASADAAIIYNHQEVPHDQTPHTDVDLRICDIDPDTVCEFGLSVLLNFGPVPQEIVVWPGSHLALRRMDAGEDVQPISPRRVALAPGEAVLFRLDLVHAGARQPPCTARIHFFAFRLPVKSSGVCSPNHLRDFLNAHVRMERPTKRRRIDNIYGDVAEDVGPVGATLAFRRIILGGVWTPGDAPPDPDSDSDVIDLNDVCSDPEYDPEPRDPKHDQTDQAHKQTDHQTDHQSDDQSDEEVFAVDDLVAPQPDPDSLEAAEDAAAAAAAAAAIEALMSRRHAETREAVVRRRRAACEAHTQTVETLRKCLMLLRAQHDELREGLPDEPRPRHKEFLEVARHAERSLHDLAAATGLFVAIPEPSGDHPKRDATLLAPTDRELVDHVGVLAQHLSSAYRRIATCDLALAQDKHLVLAMVRRHDAAVAALLADLTELCYLDALD